MPVKIIIYFVAAIAIIYVSVHIALISFATGTLVISFIAGWYSKKLFDFTNTT